MGWASGSGLAESLWEKVSPHVAPWHRKALALEVYEMFCKEDADDWSPDSLLIRDAEIKFVDE